MSGEVIHWPKLTSKTSSQSDPDGYNPVQVVICCDRFSEEIYCMSAPEVNDLLSPEQMFRMADALEKQAKAQLDAAKNLRALAENSRINRLSPSGRTRADLASG